MKKIPTLYKRVFENGHITDILPEVNPGLDGIAQGRGVATIKYDGSCCAIIDGELYKRYDAKHGKNAPPGAIPCCEPDEITGHHPHWLKVDENNPADKWFIEAFKNTPKTELHDGTYEAVGTHFNGNKYQLNTDVLIRHGEDVIYHIDTSLDGLREFLSRNNIEGLVFWQDGEPKCKIKRTDFGMTWPSTDSVPKFGDVYPYVSRNTPYFEDLEH